MFCSKCGNNVADTARFCTKCGNRMAVAPASVHAPAPPALETYMLWTGDAQYGPYRMDEIERFCVDGCVNAETLFWNVRTPSDVKRLGEIFRFEPAEVEMPAVEPQPEVAVEPAPSALSAPSVAPQVASAPVVQKRVTIEEAEPEPGESLACPYCRTVSDLSDLLSVSVSPGLLGDSVLGDDEQRRFLPTQFNANGLAVDDDGGVCVECACPYCHMTLPRALLEVPQLVMSVVGAAGAGKSVYLASAVWQCRQKLRKLFGVSFTDLDPVANRWINAYEERLFFQESDTTLQQIEKTDVNSSNVSRMVNLGGDSVLLPLPSFFQVAAKRGGRSCLVVYDSAGEHFRAGADTNASNVTLNMLRADSLFFMFDPSADPRFAGMLDRGGGTAKNYAQRQDILLAELAARIKRHLGNNGGDKLGRPLLFGVSKADLLRQELPLDARLYAPKADGSCALDLKALNEVSRKTEALLADTAPEIVATAHDIADEVVFMPVSALGHNPMREGVRPCDIKPIWTELPFVYTLARKGFVKTVSK